MACDLANGQNAARLGFISHSAFHSLQFHFALPLHSQLTMKHYGPAICHLNAPFLSCACICGTWHRHQDGLQYKKAYLATCNLALGAWRVAPATATAVCCVLAPSAFSVSSVDSGVLPLISSLHLPQRQPLQAKQSTKEEPLLCHPRGCDSNLPRSICYCLVCQHLVSYACAGLSVDG